jgi:uncharacterized oxidoreductase
MKIAGNTILITGGGSGIGRALARRLHDEGNEVIVAGRRREELNETIAGRDRMSAHILDVQDPTAIKAFVRGVITEHPGLNVLINNAGIMRWEQIHEHRDLDDAEAMVVTNLLGPIRLTNELISHLTGRSDATIVNVSSGLAFVPFPSAPTYSATKSAIHSYTVSLRERLKGKVEVIELAPPAVQTDLTPGQSTRAGYMPLTDFVDEVMTILRQQPTPAEVLVERVKPLRYAEVEGRFEQVLATFSAH